MRRILRKIRRIVAFTLAVVLTASLMPAEYLSGLFTESFPGNVEADVTLSNPRIVEDSSMESGQKVTWDCIWFGSYPQTEIVDQASTCGTFRKAWGKESDYEVNASLYNTLQNTTGWDSNGDVIVDGKKYRRLKKDDATYSSGNGDYYYNWSDSTSYHYFRYDPIKWRVLDVSEGKAFLLADKTLDTQCYYIWRSDVTWETSTIRSWMNGYSVPDNIAGWIPGLDYSSNNFIDNAFSSKEQNAIFTTNVVNDDNIDYGTEGGNDTDDMIFLLSESEVYNTQKANSYGFVTDSSTYDEARRSKSSTYAKAMGVLNDSFSYAGNCLWYLRSPGDNSGSVMRAINISYEGDTKHYICDVSSGVRPALNLNLSSSTWSYAGTVCSNGNSNEQDTPGSGGESGSFDVDSEHCGIIFSDYNTGKEIKGVTFTYNGVKYTSKSDGSTLVVVPNFTNKLNTKFSANGYMDYKVSDVELIRGGVLNITLVPVADKPTVYRCEMQYDGSSSTVDVLNKSKTLAQGSKKQFSLTAVAGYKDEIAKYQLISDGKIIKESTSGVFSGLTAASFKAGASICIRAAGKKGRGYAYGSTQQLYLKVKNNILADSNTQETVSVGEKITIQLDSSIPLLGGNEISFDLGELPVYFETDGSKIRAGINFGQASASNDGKKWEGSAFRGFSDENWAKIKESVKKNFSPKEFMKKNKKAKDIFKTQGVLFADVGTVSAEADVWGYLEADMDNSYVSGEISITASISASTENQFAAGAIPMVLTVKLSGGLDDGTVNLTASTGITSLKDLKLTATVKPQIGLDVGVGPGMAKLGSLTVNGKGNLSYTYTRTTALESQKVDLTAGMYLKFKALSFEYKKNIAENTWILYNDSKTVRSAGTAAVDLMDTGQYELADRSYLQTQSEWNPASKARTFAVDTGSTTPLIQSSVYDDPQLQVVQAGDVTMMIFLTDDSSRTDINRTKLVYSIYDKETEKWGEPQAVEDDGTADFMPAAAKYGNDIYIAWVNMNAAMGNDASQEAFAAAGEISLAKYNGTGFEVTRLTNNDYYDTMPAISADETGVTVSWTGSISNNILGNDDQNRLYVYRSADAQTNCLAEGLQSVKDAVTGKIGTTEAAAFVSDADGDYSTTDDQTLKILGTDGNILFTRTGAGEMTRLMIKDGSLIWYEDGTLCSLSDVNGEAGLYHGFTGQINSAYEMLETDTYEYLVCLDSVRDETDDFTDVEMYAYIYDKAEQSWGERVNITNIGSAVQDYAVFLTEDGSLAGVLGINAFSYENEEYSNTMSLYALKAAPAADYELSEVYYSDVVESEDGYGYQLDAVADIKNIGIAKGNDYTFDLKKGDTVIDSVSLPALPAGKECSEEVTFHLQNLPEENSDYMVVINAEDENNLENNSKTINLGHANLSISCDDTIQDDIHTVRVTVKNDSLYDVNNASVALYFDEDGETIETKEIGILSGSDQTTFTTEINANEVMFDSDSKLVFAKVTSDSSELTEEDNTDFFSIDKPVGSVALPDDNTVVDEGGTDIDIKPDDTGSTGNTDTGKKPGTPSKSQLLRITLSGISKKIAAGKKIKLTAQGIPVGAPLPNLKWTSSNPKVATVTQTGVVTVKKKTGGKSVTITATATDGSGISASWKIKSMKGVVKKIAVSGAKTVKAGKSLKLKAKVTATKGANKKLKWTSSNTRYATVSSSGKVKALKAGKGKKVSITAMATDGSNKKKTVTIKIK